MLKFWKTNVIRKKAEKILKYKDFTLETARV